MKINKLIIGCLSIAAIFSGCLDKIDIPQSNTLTVTLNNSGLKFVTSDLTVNPKDSLYFDAMIGCPKDMKYLIFQKNGTDLTKDTLPASSKNFLAVVKRIAADSVAGVYTYKILAKDAAGIYLGEKNIVVTVASDFTYYSLKKLYVPDSTAKTNQAFFGSLTGELFSYSTMGSNSGNIDFGYYYDTAAAKKHTIYALNMTPLPSQLAIYNMSTWTKNATLLKKGTSPSFASLTSSGSLRSAGLTNLASGTTTSITSLVTGNVVFFRTVTGKYGALTVNFTNQDAASPDTYINIDVKVQK